MNPRYSNSRRTMLLAAALAAGLLGTQAQTLAQKAARKANAQAQAPQQAQTSKAEPPKNTVNRNFDSFALARKIDAAIDARLKEEKIPASPRASDAEFIRRASLDILGIIPTAERVAKFLDEKSADKRARLIDEFLASTQYGRHMADLWQTLLVPKNSDNRRLQTTPLFNWMEQKFNANTPWNVQVYELLTATGTQDKNGATTYYVALGTVDRITDNVTKQFLGVQLQCAQCHNHPFTGWKQDEYWAMAAFFMKVQSDNPNRAARNGEVVGVREAPRIIRNRRTLPESAKILPAKFLQGEKPVLKETEPYRPVLAEWITSPKNPFFAKAMVNRLWAQFFGRGLVNPVDDMHEGNAPSHPQLLKELADGFVASGFDVKALIRAICASEAYQRTSKPVKGNEDAEPHLYARMNVKVLTPEQVFDSYSQVLNFSRNAARPNRQQAQRGQPNSPRDQFVAFFGIEEGADPTEYQAGIPQVLRLMNANLFNPRAAVAGVLQKTRKNEEVIEQLYLMTLSRRPTQTEMTRLAPRMQKGDVRSNYEDLLWALLNCSEFMLNH